MEELSDYFKRGIYNLQKQAIEKSYKQKTLKSRMDEYNGERRQTRTTLLFKKRNIDAENFSPYNTPDNDRKVTKPIPKPTPEDGPSKKRLEMLQKWKAEKEKRKREDRLKSKPVFKVYHIPIHVGLPNLDNVNKEIKGKPIQMSDKIVSKFAPQNHIFKPPANIQPIKFRSTPNLKGLQTGDDIKKVQKNKFSHIKSKLLLKTDKKNVDHTRDSKKISAVATNSNKKQTHVVQKNIKMTGSVSAITRKADISNSLTSVTSKRVDKVPTQSIKTDKSTKTTSRSCKEPEKYPNKSNVGQLPKKVYKISEKTITKQEKVQRKPVDINEIRGKSKINSRNSIKKSKLIEQNCDTMNEIKTPENLRKTHNESFIMYNDEEITLKTPYKTPENHTNSKKSKTESYIMYNDEEITLKTPHKTPENYMNSRKSQNESYIIYNDEEITLKTPHKIPECGYESRKSKNEPVKYNDEEISLKPSLHTPGKTPRKSISKLPISNNVKVTASASKVYRTPVNKKIETSSVYISPFVTISRGKNYARKEFIIRQSTGGTLPDTPEFGKNLAASTSPSAGALYFLKQLDDEISRIQNICDNWTTVKDDNIPEDAKDLIDTAVGQSQLLIAKKFRQFRDLIIQCRDCQYKEKPVTCTDLHGFWDTMYMQVEDINRRFAYLQKLKDNNWKELISDEQREKIQVIKSRPARQTKIKAASKIKDMIKQARARQAKQSVKTGNSDFIISEELVPKSDNKRRSKRLSSLQVESAKPRISSPGLTMMKITQAIKQGDGVTPSSILKKSGAKSERRMTKCVLFKDLEEAKEQTLSMARELDKENINSVNVNTLTPQRRSKRLTINLL